MQARCGVVNHRSEMCSRGQTDSCDHTELTLTALRAINDCSGPELDYCHATGTIRKGRERKEGKERKMVFI